MCLFLHKECYLRGTFSLKGSSLHAHIGWISNDNMITLTEVFSLFENAKGFGVSERNRKIAGHNLRVECRKLFPRGDNFRFGQAGLNQ